MSVNTTDIAQLDQAAGESERSFRGLLEGSREAIVLLDHSGRIIFATSSMTRLMGRRPDELIGNSFLALLDPEDAPKFEKLLGEGRESKIIEFRMLSSAGASLQLAASVRRLPSSTSNGVFAVSLRLANDGADTQPTSGENRQDPLARGALFEQLRLQARILNLTEDAVWLTDPDEKIQYWNKGAERLYGWTAEEAVGHNARMLLWNAPDSQAQISFEETFKKGQWEGELNKTAKSQKKLTVRSRWRLVREGDLSQALVLVVESDITERKALESQFLRAQRMEGLGRLVSGIAHDLNNLLVPILLSVPMLRLPHAEAEGEKMLNTIQSSAQRGAELVRQLLTYGCGVSGDGGMVDMSRLITDFISLLGETFPKGITISSKWPQDLWLVPGDRTQLYQILLNLCVNARDAMSHGGTLSLNADNICFDAANPPPKREAPPGKYLRLRVADTGTGIPANIVDKIFDPFFTTKVQGEGSGLGLSTVVRIIGSHGGFLDLVTEPGKGSQFDVYLPAAGAGERMPAEHPPDQPAKPQPPDGRGETILVVDDEVDILRLLKETLVQHNYRVITAEDGTEAMSAYARHQAEISLVLTDIVMPVLDGVSLARALKKTNPAVKIIAVGGIGNLQDQREQIAQLNELGVMSFLGKPFTSEHVLATLHEMLKK